MKNVRRLPIVAALLLGLVALVVFGSEEEAVPDSEFASLAPPGMPFAPAAPSLTTSWFCPGVPTTDDRGGDIVVTNPGDVVARGRLTVYSTEGDPVVQPVQVGVRDSASFRLEEISVGEYLSALVEIDSGLAYAEQRVRHPNGTSVQPCSNASASEWYLADGITEGAGYDLVVTNPFPDYTNVSVTIATETSRRTPSELQNQTVAGRSVLKLDLEEFGLRDEPVVSVSVTASPQRIVVGRAQNYRGGDGRRGYSMTLAAPSLDSYWFFPDGERDDDVTETITIYNPAAEATTVLLEVFTEREPEAGFVGVEEYDVTAAGVTVVDVGAIAGLPIGRHSIRVTTDGSGPGVVAEQAITRGAGTNASTAVSLGTRVATSRWWAPTPISTSTQNALVVANRSGLDGTVTVFALGPGGLVPVLGLQDVPLLAAVEGVGGTISIDLTSDEVVGRPVLVEATVNIAVSRRPPRGVDLPGRTAALALPELG